MHTESFTLDKVKEYYGSILQTNKDLKTSACCAAESLPTHLQEISKQIHPEVKEKFYGCGITIPHDLEGCTVLDLGSGSGRDCYLLSKLVGSKGNVIGVDMTAEQLAVAEKHQEHHRKSFGFESSNVQFLKGYIEDLESLGIESNSVDVVVSNCVINLSPNKPQVLKEVFRVLKPGGELYFSDVFADRRLPEPFRKDPVLLGECLGGAMYTEDFRRSLLSLGCQDLRIVSKSPIQIINPEIQKKVGMTKFTSYTIRAFKLNIEDKCEDYGQVAWYLGSVPETPHAFLLDDHHLFEKGRPMAVCSNTAAMLEKTRYKKHFRIEGDLSTHYGLFPCGPQSADINVSPTGGACC